MRPILSHLSEQFLDAYLDIQSKRTKELKKHNQYGSKDYKK